ncbi:8-oxoguanine DNA glycosylase OGG fold protein [Streptomyces sp. DW26H14]|uniref:8-oxoguanine DNA glycosylase OGG fold protein n=1 Tax=Streptomyces sp. DW26H14 TaxID=3435395 RepID=UPI00403DBB72
MGSRQDRADALDGEMRARLLPKSAIALLSGWLKGDGARFAEGVGSHAVRYHPARWSAICHWPGGLADRGLDGEASVSRAQVAQMVRDAGAAGDWDEALVATYVWGQGRIGYGPHRLEEILSQGHLAETLARAGSVLGEQGAEAAYGALRKALKGYGPAFFTKFLYFLGAAGRPVSGLAPLILDQRLASVHRAHATRTGLRAGMEDAAATAAWVWSDGGWTPHRYGVYLDWMAASCGQLASAGIGWPPSCPDLLELALFSGVWDPRRDAE